MIGVTKRWWYDLLIWLTSGMIWSYFALMLWCTDTIWYYLAWMLWCIDVIWSYLALMLWCTDDMIWCYFMLTYDTLMLWFHLMLWCSGCMVWWCETLMLMYDGVSHWCYAMMLWATDAMLWWYEPLMLCCGGMSHWCYVMLTVFLFCVFAQSHKLHLVADELTAVRTNLLTQGYDVDADYVSSSSVWHYRVPDQISPPLPPPLPHTHLKQQVDISTDSKPVVIFLSKVPSLFSAVAFELVWLKSEIWKEILKVEGFGLSVAWALLP